MNRSSCWPLFHALTLVFVVASAARAEVTATLSKGKLKLTSDADSDIITVEGNGELGRVAVLANGSNAGEFSGVRDIDVKTGAGDDQVSFLGIQIGGNLRAKLGDGGDNLRLDAVGFPVVKQVLIGGNLDVTLGGDAGDSFAVGTASDAPVNILGNVTIRGASLIDMDGDGINPALENLDIVIGGKFRIERAGGDANAAPIDFYHLDDVVVGGDAKLVFGDENDELRITDSQFARKVTIQLRGGDDIVDFRNDATKFDGPIDFIGGSGVDSLVDSNGCEFSVQPTFKQMEVVP